MSDGRTIVIGAGMGGLVAALMLAHGGHEVLILEKDAHAGGKMRQMQVAGRSIDCGPTVLTLKPVFQEIVGACGLSLDAMVRMTRLDVLARHAWSASERLDLFADPRRSADAIGTFAGSAAARGYLDFCAHAKGVYDTMNGLFMRAERPTPHGMVRAGGLSGLKALWSAAPFTPLWDALGAYFPDPRLRQLFGRYATYCGSSPFLAPATLALIAHVEQQGVWAVEGGMGAFASALAAAAQSKGAVIHLGAEVASILSTSGRVTGVRLTTGETLACASIVANVDAGALTSGQFGETTRGAVPADATLPRSLSAATWGFVAEAQGFSLAHHNVFFSRACREEFDDLFVRDAMPSDPTVYICAEDRGSGAGVAEGAIERLFGIVNAPASAAPSPDPAEDMQRCLSRTMRTLERCGLTLRIEAMEAVGPADFAQRFPGTGGAIYGMASHGWTASFRRPGAQTALEGLYLAGGSVHPGAGLPMAALSGRNAALRVMAGRVSTSRSHPGGTRGGTSTR